MPHEEYMRKSWKEGYRKCTKEELEDRADTCRFMLSYNPQDTWYKESLELIEEVLKEKSYSKPEEVDEADVENHLYVWGF